MEGDSSRVVTVHWADRYGDTGASYSSKLGHSDFMVSQNLNNGEHNVMWYTMDQTETSFIRLNATKGISKFWYEVEENGKTRTEDQDGSGFPLQDVVMLANSSCTDILGSTVKSNINIAVRSALLACYRDLPPTKSSPIGAFG